MHLVCTLLRRNPSDYPHPSLFFFFLGGGLIENSKASPEKRKDCSSAKPSNSDEFMGGVEKGGGWKTSRMTPLPQRGFGPPPRTVRCPPPSGVSALCFLYKNLRQSRPEALLEGSKNFRESAFSGTFSSPHTFCTPPYHGPNFKVTKK